MRPSARSATWWLLREGEPTDRLSDEERVFVAALYEAWPELRESVTLVQEFRRLLRDREHTSLAAWAELVSTSAEN